MQSLAARSTPYRVPPPAGTRTCNCCGINKTTSNRAPDYYCRDCTPMARDLGWIEPPPTYTCTRCARQVRGKTRELCGGCTWVIKQRKAS